LEAGWVGTSGPWPASGVRDLSTGGETTSRINKEHSGDQ